MMESDTLFCNKDECTFAQTGSCILDNDPDICPNRNIPLTVAEVLNQYDLDITDSPSEKQRFTSSYTFTTEQTEIFMAEQYCKVVGILGVPGAGKTACLVSLYLMLSHNTLGNFRFRNSKTLMAFEEISTGARQWSKADNLKKLTVHTEILDERTDGFLHLNLYSEKSQSNIHFLLPDLPGEWTTSFITKGKTDRLDFLKSAECIWIMVNNEHVVSIETRNATIHKLTLLIERLNDFLGSEKVRIALVATHIDGSPFEERFYSKVVEASESYGFNLKIFPVASFSADDLTSPGTGIEALFDDLLNGCKPVQTNYRNSVDQQTDRQMMRFGLKEI
jgi:hypothetical protein